MRLTLKAVAIAAWGATAAIAVNLLFQFRWWHPVCMPNAEGAGPYGYAIGLPLPFAQPTGVASMAFFMMPHIYALDVMLLTGTACLLILVPASLIDIFYGRSGRIVAVSGAVALALAIASQSFVFSMDWLPVVSIATKPERLLDYRPAIMTDRARVRSCSY